MLHTMAVNIAHFFSVNSDVPFDEDDIELYAFGTELLIAGILETLAILALGMFAGKTLETISFLIGFIALRSYTGGYHAATHLKCFLTALFTYSIFLLVQFITPVWIIKSAVLIMTFVSAFPVILFAPIANVNKPIGPVQHKKFRKLSLTVYLIQAVIIVGLSISGIIPYIALGFAIGQVIASGSLVADKIRDHITREVN